MNLFRNDQPFTEAKARNCFIVNQFATPGLGSLMGGKWISGLSQLTLAVIGFFLVMAWFFLTLKQEYALIDGAGQPTSYNWVGVCGAAVFGAAWLWALFTSIQLLRLGGKNSAAASLVPPRYSGPPER